MPRGYTGGSDGLMYWMLQTGPAEWGEMIWQVLLPDTGLQWQTEGQCQLNVCLRPEQLLPSRLICVQGGKRRPEGKQLVCVFTLNRRRRMGMLLSMSARFSVGFLSSGVTWACLNEVREVPVRIVVFMMCVNAGKMAWRRWKGNRVKANWRVEDYGLHPLGVERKRAESWWELTADVCYLVYENSSEVISLQMREVNILKGLRVSESWWWRWCDKLSQWRHWETQRRLVWDATYLSWKLTEAWGCWWTKKIIHFLHFS